MFTFHTVKVILLRYQIIYVFLLVSLTQAQPDTLWTTEVGGNNRDKCYSAALTSDNGFLLGGTTYSPENGMIYGVAKIDSAGEEQWFCGFGGPRADQGRAVIETTDGLYLISGESNSFGNGLSDGFVIKLSLDGDSIWARLYSGDANGKFRDGIATEDGGYVMTGTLSGNIWLLKADVDGEVEWERTYQVGNSNLPYAVTRTSDRGFALAGASGVVNVGRNYFLIKTDSLGNEEWTGTYGTEASEFCKAVVQTDDDGFLMVGSRNRPGTPHYDFYIVRTDDKGELLWDRIYDRQRDDLCESVIKKPDGGFVLAGWEYRFPRDYLIIRIDSAGEILWMGEYGGEEEEYCYDILALDDGGYAFAGYSNSFLPGSDDLWLVRTEPDPVSVPRLIDPTYSYSFTLHSPYPNPFNSTASISYSIPFYSHVSLSVFDLSGRRAATLVDECTQPGIYGTTLKSNNMASGTYFIRLQSAKTTQSYKIVLLK